MADNGCNGVIVPPGTNYCSAANSFYGTNFIAGTPCSNKYLQSVKYNAFAPRIGVSWDPTGSGNNAIRAGFGMFYQRDRTSATGYQLGTNVPFVLNAGVTRTLDGPNPAGLPTGGASPGGGIVLNGNLPYSLQWNLAVEHGFAKNTTLEVAYVGNHAVDILNSYDENYIPPSQWLAASFVSGGGYEAFRPYGTGSWGGSNGQGVLTQWEHNGSASYNSLQVLFKTQIQKFQMQAAYTYSHSIGDVVLDDSSGGIGYQSYLWGPNPSLNRGNTQINRPQIFVANLVYYLPDLKGQNEMIQQVAGGWELGAITQYASGTSVSFGQSGVAEDTNLTINNATNNLSSLFGVGYTPPQRPLVNSGQSCTAGTGGSQVLNPNAVTLVGYVIGTIPNNLEPSGYCHGPGYVNTDFSVDKNWRVKERVSIQFRFDFFNLWNHPNFYGNQINGIIQGSDSSFSNVNCGAANSAGLYQPCSMTNNVISRATTATSLGQATQARTGRELQYGLKVIF